jgi:hypothetical protein
MSDQSEQLEEPMPVQTNNGPREEDGEQPAPGEQVPGVVRTDLV